MSDTSVVEVTDTPPPPTSPGSVAVPGLVGVAAVASIAAGLLHYAAAALHLPAEAPAAMLFTLIGAFQLVWVALLGRPRRWVVLAGILVNATAVVAWLLIRTVALPFGHHAGEVQAVGLLDGGSVAAELVVIVAAIAILRRLGGTTQDPVT